MSVLPLVSVIIPAYSRPDLLRDAIRSVLADGYGRVEVIVVDDGSPTDVTAGLLDEFRGAPVQVVRQQNAGTAVARNHGCAVAAGTYLMLLDDDDLVVTDSLGWRVAFLEANPEYSAVGGRCEFLQGDEPAGHEPVRWTGAFEPWDLLVHNRFYSVGQVLIRRTAFTQVEGCRPEFLGSDEWDLWIQLAHVGPVWMDARPALRYRYHAANFSRDVVMMVNGAVAVADRWLAATCPRHVESARFLTYHFISAIYADKLEASVAHARQRGDHAAARRSSTFLTSLRTRLLGARLRLKWSLLRHFGQWRLDEGTGATLGRQCTACAEMRTRQRRGPAARAA